MSSLLAVLQQDAQPVQTAWIDRLLAATANQAVDGQKTWLHGSVALAHQHLWITPEEVGEEQPLVCDAGQLAITATVRLDNRGALAQRLGLDPDRLSRTSDAALLLLAYRRWDTDCAAYLLGDFAFVIWDAAAQRLFAAGDQIGVRGLVYTHSGRRVIISSSIPPLLAVPGFQKRVNDRKVVQYLTNTWEEDSATFFHDIHHLPPARTLIATRDGLSIRRYWDITPDRRIRYRRDQDYAEHYRELLDEAVRCRMRTAWPVGISLSGGIDSAAVAAVAATQLPTLRRVPQPLHSFSWVFDELKSCDERAWIEPVVERHGIQAHVLPGDDCWPLRDLATWPVMLDHPGQDAYILLRRRVMAAAQASGCRVLLTGYHSEALLYGWRYWMVDAVREAQFSRLAMVAQHKPERSAWRTGFNYLVRQMVPREVRHAYRRVKRVLRGRRDLFDPNPIVSPDLLARTRFNREVMEAQRWREFSAPGQWERYRVLTAGEVALGLNANAADYCAHGVQSLSPFQDRRLAEFCLALPAYALGVPGQSKQLLRRAVQDILPAEIIALGKVGSLLPLYHRSVMEREKAIVAALLADPHIVQHGYIDGVALRRLVEGYQGDQAASFWLWAAITLELWLQKHQA